MLLDQAMKTAVTVDFVGPLHLEEHFLGQLLLLVHRLRVEGTIWSSIGAAIDKYS